MEFLRLIGGFALAVVVLIILYAIIMKVLKGTADMLTSGVRTTQHGGRWGYYFHDAYGSMISHTGFLTETGALRAAQRERNKVAKELQEACGL